MQAVRFLTFPMLIITVVACATMTPDGAQRDAPAPVATEPLIIGNGTTAAIDQGSSGASPGDNRAAVVPPGTLRVSKVSRKKSEMRQGPGINFALVDRILEEGNKVIVFEQHGVWAKVLSVGAWDAGWVHAGTITTPELNKTPMTVHVAKFPTVLALRPVSHGVAFSDGDTVRLNETIPKGRMFRALQIAGDRTLVWITERNEIFWIKRKDMQ